MRLESWVWLRHIFQINDVYLFEMVNYFFNPEREITIQNLLPFMIDYEQETSIPSFQKYKLF